MSAVLSLHNRKFKQMPKAATGKPGARSSSLHQLAPYIGRLPATLATALVKKYSAPGELVYDPFCGSGTVPLECALQGRRVLASDNSYYAYVLTRAKLEAPSSLQEAIADLDVTLAAARERKVSTRSAPDWVRKFFHPKTLRETIAFVDECLENERYFLLSCILGILHHQRPGFLSYPSSHLVPYLRDKKFPRDEFPALYEYRDIESRLRKKVNRMMAHAGRDWLAGMHRVGRRGIESIAFRTKVDSIVTSPPYMNALDYRRDNRLRLWFLERNTHNYEVEPTSKREAFDDMARAFCRRALPLLRADGRAVLVIGDSIRRKQHEGHPANHFASVIAQCPIAMELETVFEDAIPDIRRSRRECEGSKTELVLVYRKLG